MAASLQKQWLGEINISDWKTALGKIVKEWPYTGKKRGDLFLILCGSFIGFTEREVLGQKSPLFGRRTAQIKLNPFPYFEAAHFHPSWSIENQAIAWYICGGIPYYLEFFEESKSIESNIIDNMLDEHSALYHEPDFLLREELRELPVYNGILTAISDGKHKISEIASRTGIDEKNSVITFKNCVSWDTFQKNIP
ncbi:MAG: ATP-binding protein [Fibrobacteria bacterium]|nr:ATP-binding protein [Fibrobacteria bacterium]